MKRDGMVTRVEPGVITKHLLLMVKQLSGLDQLHPLVV